MGTRKRIAVDQLKPGMFLVELDRPWIKTPLLFHKRLIRRPEEIDLLKRHGIREVTIDLGKGADIDKSAGSAPASLPQSAETPATNPDTRVPSDRPGLLPGTGKLLAARKMYAEAHSVMECFLDDATMDREPAITPLKDLVSTMLDRILDDRTSVLTQLFLGQMQRYDRSLAVHAVDTCVLSLIFGTEFGLTGEDREAVGTGALLHDIGYLRLPRNLYRRAHSCTEQERRLMQEHPRLGVAMLAGSKDVRDNIARVVREHHERRDGSGFPAGLAGPAISPLSQLVGLVDTYDGLVNPRGSQTPLIPHEAIRQLFVLGQKGQFEMEIVEVAIKALGVYPIGSLVQLNTGERGVVVAVNPLQRLKPVLALISDAHQQLSQEPLFVDLSEQDASAPPRSIVQCLDPAHERIDIAAYLQLCLNGQQT
ncbi:MAG: DUF3391 domain-containing protein [Nitrospirota bacterium]